MTHVSINNLPFPLQYGYSIIIGNASANGTITLVWSLDNFQWIAILGVAGNYIRAMHFIPVALFKQGVTWYLGSNDGTARRIAVKYSSDTKITVSNRATFNVYIVGVK